MKIIALTTCHNRCAMTLRALRALERQNLPSNCELQICIVDDASGDGTARAVRAAFPSVIVLEGPGNLFWAGGMRFGWTSYVERQNPNYLLVFNDDVEMFEDALNVLLSVARQVETEDCSAFVISGALVNPDTDGMTYGGAVRKGGWHPLRFQRIQTSKAAQECDAINMNIALISRSALRLVGFLAADFAHGRADYDFALRLRAAGGRALLAPGYLGSCKVNPSTGTSREPGLSFADRWRRLTGVKEQPPRERAAFYRRHGGRFWFCFWALPYLRIAMESVGNVARKAINPRRHK